MEGTAGTRLMEHGPVLMILYTKFIFMLLDGPGSSRA